MGESGEKYTPLGTHRVRVDGDAVYFVLEGAFTEPDLIAILDILARVKREHGRLFVYYDVRKGTGIDTRTRRAIITRNSVDSQPDMQVLFGISFTLRVILNMVIRAQKLLRNFDVPLFIVETEAEAKSLFARETTRMRNS